MTQPTFKEGKSGLYFVRNPETGEIERHEGADAARLMDVSGWEPVSAEEAAPIIQGQAVARNATVTEGLLLGADKAVTGGISDMLLDPNSKAAQGVRNIEQGAPIATGTGEALGTIAPFLPGLGKLGAGTVPRLLDAAGQGVTTAARGAAPGVARTVLSRMAGVGVEGAGQVTLDQARKAHLSDEPVNAGRLLDAYGFGVMLPALVVGAPIGAVEGALGSISRRALQRAGKVKQNVWRPGVSEKDAIDIARREHGVAAPGIMDQLHAANANSPHLQDPDFWVMARDKGPAGEQYRQELLDADLLRPQAEAELAQHLNSGLDVDRFASTNWSGKLKEKRVRDWINDDDIAPADAFARIQELRQDPKAMVDFALRARDEIRRKSALGAEIATALGVDQRTVSSVIRNGLASGDETVTQQAMRLLKQEDIKTSAWRDEALRAIDQYGEVFSVMRDRGKGHVGEQAGKIDRALELLDGTRASVMNAPRSKAFAELDWMKKRFADYAKPDQYLGAGDDVARNARNAHETFRQMLEDGRFWGDKAASAQRDMNAIFHKRMSRKDAFYDNWFDDAGVPDPTNPWANLRKATPEKVRSVIGDVTDVNHDKIAGYRAHIRETRELIDAAKKHYDLTPEEVALMGQQAEAVSAAEDSLGRAVMYNLRVNQANALRQTGALGRGSGARSVVGAVVGGTLGGVPGAVAGTAIQAMLNPGTTIYARAVWERLLRQNEGRMARAVEKLLTGKVRAPSLGVAQTLSRLSRVVDSPHGTKQEEYKDSVKEMLAAAQQPEKIDILLKSEFGPVTELMPGLVANGSERLRKGLQYAIQRAPAKPVQTIYGEDISPVGDLEMDVWEREVEAALDPSSILDMAADEELIPEAVDAAEFVAPELVSEMRQLLAEQIGEGSDISYERGLQLAILFKMPVDATTTPEYIKAQQLMYAAGEQRPKQDPRTYGETGVHQRDNMAQGDRLSSGIPPQ